MKVLFISHDSGLYGATRSLLNLALALKGMNINPYIIIPHKGEMEQELKKSHIRYQIIPYVMNYRKIGDASFVKAASSELYNIRAVAKLVCIIKEEQIDIVHTNNLCCDIGAVAAFLTGKPHVWHMREFMEEHFNIEFYNKPKMKYLLNRSNARIAISKSLYDKYSGIYKSKNMRIIHNGFPFEDYIINRKDYFPNDEITILLCGAISPKKGQAEAIKAVCYLHHKGVRNLKLHLVGGGEQTYINKLKNFIKSNGLQQMITVHKFQKDLSKFRQDADIALICSKFEAFGRVTVESMLGELLVIGSDSAGTKELLLDGKMGILYKQDDYKDLADKLFYAVHHKKDCIRIIKQAKDYAQKSFSINTTAEKVKEVYKDIMTY